MPHSFVGRYCGLGAVVGPPTVGLGIPVGINVGSCFPSGCTDTDISTIVTLVLRGAGLNVTEDVNVGCQERELPYSTGAIVTIHKLLPSVSDLILLTKLKLSGICYLIFQHIWLDFTQILSLLAVTELCYCVMGHVPACYTL
ncbi:hypothetical protein EB796_009204 [Bugula neritina]|uniref:Uncharacterized protein n=1 Tax=Bugula neritina TaxID=10212 RepID=A0A7J7K2S8_BUGNE|nr:hypothetical protein EB796_009204 [Bugula neritina]